MVKKVPFTEAELSSLIPGKTKAYFGPAGIPVFTLKSNDAHQLVIDNGAAQITFNKDDKAFAECVRSLLIVNVEPDFRPEPITAKPTSGPRLKINGGKYVEYPISEYLVYNSSDEVFIAPVIGKRTFASIALANTIHGTSTVNWIRERTIIASDGAYLAMLNEHPGQVVMLDKSSQRMKKSIPIKE